MAAVNKSKITCFECSASFLFDLNRLPPEVHEKKCIKCGAAIPLVNRIIQAKQKPKVVRLVSHAAVENPAKPEEDAYARYLVPEVGGDDSYETAEEGGAWLATYGDIMSLLLIFFILMFSISVIDKNKFEMVMSAISESLGGQVKFIEVPVTTKENAIDVITSAMQRERLYMSDLYRRLSEFVVHNQLQDQIALSDENENIVLMIKGMAVFDSGTAELRADILPVLLKIGRLLKGIDNLIVVEGHTDDIPINTARFPSNWELSTSRAANVVHFLVDDCEIEANRLSVAGYSHYKPRYDLSGPEGKLNRRIEILVKKKYSTNLTDQLLSAQSK